MSPVPASAITIADGEITLDADLLAPKLGLSSNTEPPSLLDLVRQFTGGCDIVREMNTSRGLRAIIGANCNTATSKETAMSSHPNDFQGSVIDAQREAI